MPPKRKSNVVEEKQRSTSKKAKLSSLENNTKLKTGAPKPRVKTPVKTKAKAPVKPKAKTPVKPKAKTPVKPKAKTPVKPKTLVKSKGMPSGRPIPAHSLIPREAPPRRPRAWEEKAAQVMHEHLQQMQSTGHLKQRSAQKSKDLTDPSLSCEDRRNNGYIQAYWNLPTLKHRDELPPCYFRACIFDGYRDHWTWYEATVSLFSMHNETMCIWSHLFPLLCAVVAAVWLGLQMQADGSTLVEQLMMGIYICTACTCLLLSSLYHWYGCMSAGHYMCLLSFDLGGIACLIAGSFFPGVYYGKYSAAFLLVLISTTSDKISLYLLCFTSIPQKSSQHFHFTSHHVSCHLLVVYS